MTRKRGNKDAFNVILLFIDNKNKFSAILLPIQNKIVTFVGDKSIKEYEDNIKKKVMCRRHFFHFLLVVVVNRFDK